jgi:hypothetical protein
LSESTAETDGWGERKRRKKKDNNNGV